ncbi:Hydroxycarboxylic acid receptor 2 [Dissostichus eleginoides]|uniref:Hydroxycarboxylic acid receptor 2 n=1 Tax=Dissostichus eleginoides TaxID=100907 RepID=A0AAD9B430_DISEL|nr:Hydroxycarboxylic acid receptor 2 [Dissostichus eleginoides]
MSVNDIIDHCKVPNNSTYEVLSWVMLGEFVLGLPLNLSVLYIFIFRYKFWKNKSIFLFNIVVADFLLMVILPAKAYHYHHGQRRSPIKAVCKTMHFMLFLNRGASIAFLITLSIDRYFNVVHLGRRNFVKVLKKTPQISILIWVLLLPLTIPTCHGRKEETPSHDVTDTFREIVYFTQIIIPFIILVYCTVRIVNRLRRKTVGEKTKLRRAVLVVISSLCVRPLLPAKHYSQSGAAGLQAEELAGFKDAYISTFCPQFLQRKLLKADFGLGTTTTTTITMNSANRTVFLPIVEK